VRKNAPDDLRQTCPILGTDSPRFQRCPRACRKARGRAFLLRCMHITRTARRALLFKRHGDADGRYQDPQPDWADVLKRSGAKLE
jgi:hypothetical protein